MLAFFDPISGVSGDMILGALLDAGLPLADLQADLRKLPLDGYRIVAAPAEQHGLRGTRVQVYLDDTEQPHRHLREIVAIIEAGELTDAIKQRAIAVFKLLAQAEAQVHGTTPDEVHFHEVGAVDAIVDVVGAVAGLARLDVAECYCGPLPLPFNGGFVRAAHGLLPLPAPATLRILAGRDTLTRELPTDQELVTPTGAAIVATLCRFEQPNFRLKGSGTGYGQRTLPWPNVLRLVLGESA